MTSRFFSGDVTPGIASACAANRVPGDIESSGERAHRAPAIGTPRCQDEATASLVDGCAPTFGGNSADRRLRDSELLGESPKGWSPRSLANDLNGFVGELGVAILCTADSMGIGRVSSRTSIAFQVLPSIVDLNLVPMVDDLSASQTLFQMPRDCQPMFKNVSLASGKRVPGQIECPVAIADNKRLPIRESATSVAAVEARRLRVWRNKDNLAHGAGPLAFRGHAQAAERVAACHTAGFLIDRDVSLKPPTADRASLVQSSGPTSLCWHRSYFTDSELW